MYVSVYTHKYTRARARVVLCKIIDKVRLLGFRTFPLMTRPQAKRRTPSNKDFSVFSKPSFSSYRSDSVYCTVALFIIIIIGIQPLGRFWAETRAQSVNWYSSGTLHHGQVLRGSLPLLSPAFRRSHFRHQVPQRRERS